MVQVLAGRSAVIATAFTDFNGRYHIANLAPGRYQVRATAATFLPATRWDLRLAAGMRATVNLTMTMLADPAVLLPAERRLPGEPDDDWTWTLRSAPDRPILRVLGGAAVMPAGEDEAEGKQASTLHGTDAVTGGDNGFGQGGIHNVIALDRVAGSGFDIVLQADIGVPKQTAQPQPASASSATITTGYQHRDAFGGASRVMVSYASHPEIQTATNAAGMQWLRMASAQKMQLGDLAELEAGGTVYAIRSSGYALSTHPFLRVTVHAGQVWAVRYRLATARDVQAYDALDSVAGEVPVAMMNHGRLSVESGLHQEIVVTRKAGSGTVRVAVYHDAMTQPAVSGTNAASSAELAGAAATVDTETGSFRLLGASYSATGVSVAVAEPIGPAMWGSLEYATGSGLADGPDHPNADQNIAGAVAAFHPVSADVVTAAVDGKIACTHTKVRAAYRWQPDGVVTPVDAYDAGANQAYLNFYVRQAIRLGNLLPQGLEATIDVTNLLAEGYHPYLSADGRILYLAQAPRMVKAGLAFNF